MNDYQITILTAPIHLWHLVHVQELVCHRTVNVVSIYNVWLLLISNSVRTVRRNTVISTSLHTLWSEMSGEVTGFIHTLLEYQCLIHQWDGSFKKPQQLWAIRML